jgi:hypothetical protein
MACRYVDNCRLKVGHKTVWVSMKSLGNVLREGHKLGIHLMKDTFHRWKHEAHTPGTSPRVYHNECEVVAV